MTYKQLLQGIEYTGKAPDGEGVLITQDSRKVVPGAVFVCVQGRSFDGHALAQKALESGAGLVVAQKPLGTGQEIVVKDTRAAYGLLCQAFFGNPAQKLTLVAVTGTNGKTTVSTVLKQLLSACGLRCGLIGTVGSEIGDMKIPARFTTPEAWDMAALLSRMHAAGCTHVVLEASSQALAQQRLYGIHFALGVFTNLTRDHLDYHGTMESYYEAKKSLFNSCAAALINVDDEWGQRLQTELPAGIHAATYSAKDVTATHTAKDIHLSAAGVKFSWQSPDIKENICFPMPGDYSVQNALAVAAAASMLGISSKKVAEHLKDVPGVAGRCQILCSKPYTIVCDFAHTGDAIEKLLAALRPYVEGRMIVLFGCAGERDPEKRAPMSASAAEYGDMVFLTSDNPRKEELETIMQDALPALKASGKPYKVVEDRREAVLLALNELRDKDMLVLCGKGHEDYQVMNGYTLYVSEAQIVQNWIKDHNL